MRKILMTSIALVALTGTASAQFCGIFDPKCERTNANDDATCQSYGAKPGTPAYITCRTQLKTARDTQRAIILNSPDIINCTRVGWTTHCNAF